MNRPRRVRQRAQQDIRGAAPRRPAPFEPVPLDLLARRMFDLDRVAALHPPARLTMRPQPTRTDLAHEARVAARIAERDDLDEQRRGPQVRVIREPGPDVDLELGERINDDGDPNAG